MDSSNGRDWLEVVKAFSPLVTGVVLALVGYLLTGSVNQALQRRQLELSNVSEMRQLIVELSDPTTSLREAEAMAVTLSAFGGYAVPPLLNLLENGGDTKIVAARRGLRAAALTDSAAVCRGLRRVLTNRTRWFRWETHLAAIELAGELGCTELQGALERYRELVRRSRSADDLLPYADLVKGGADGIEPADTEQSLDESLELLARQSEEGP